MRVYYQNFALTQFGGIFRGVGQSFVYTTQRITGFEKFLLSPIHNKDSMNYVGHIDMPVIQGYMSYESFDKLKCQYDENPVDYFIDDKKAILHIWDNFPTGSKLKKVVTVHDLFWIAKKYQYLYGHKLADEDLFRKIFDEIDWVVCPSKFSLQDFQEFHPKYKGNTSVVPWGSKYFPYFRASQEQGSYFLFVSCPERRKNFPMLLEAYKAANIKVPLHVVANIDELYQDMKEEIKPLLKDKIIKFVGSQISEMRLIEEYRGAMALIFPSIYEGFGMPVIEAASQGCPVICSNTSSLKEFSDFTIQVDPHDKDSIVDALETVILSTDIRDSIRNAGYRALNDFSYSKAGSSYKEIYLDLYGH